MKRKHVWKWVALTLSVALFAAGCGKAPENQNNAAPSQPSAGQTQDKPAEASNLLEQVKKNGKMKVGLMGTYPPYNFMNDKHEIDGFDADIAKEIGKQLGVQVEFVPTEWAGMIEGLQKGKFDVVISQMTITEERKKAMDFSQPYIKNAVNIIVNEDNTTIHKLEDLKGHKVGVGLGTNDEKFLREVALPKVGPFDILTYNDVITSLMDLNTGRIDATLNNLYALKPLVDKNHFKIKAVGEPIKVDEAGIAVRKNNPEFLKAIDDALTKIKSDGTYNQIFKKWFGEEPKQG
jgi:cystine transport system substrate-binding protein